MSKLGEAFVLAFAGHFNQRRKWRKEPYICHPVRVMHLVKAVLTADEIKKRPGILEASICHDLLEDTEVTELQIKDAIGEDGLCLVNELTFPSSKIPLQSPREEKIKIDHAHLKTVSSTAKIIKMADRLDNLIDIEITSRKYANKYLKESIAILEICGEHNETLSEILSKMITDKIELVNGER